MLCAYVRYHQETFWQNELNRLTRFLHSDNEFACMHVQCESENFTPPQKKN